MWYALPVDPLDMVFVFGTVSICVSVLAGAIALIAWRAADPLELRRLSATVAQTLRGVSDELAHVREVELPRAVAQAEAFLERADMRFEAAESKRKTVDAKAQKMARDQAHEPRVDAHLDPSLSETERRAALRAMMSGRA